MLWILRIILVVVVAFVPVGAYAKSGHPPPNPLPSREGKLSINDVYVIHLIIDGTNYKTMRRVIAQGKMPTLKKYFVDEGAVFTRAISTFPSTSTSAYQSFITGLLPGHAGIPHLQRFDRQKKVPIDYLTLGGHAKINGDLININALQNPSVVNLDGPTTIFELLDGYPTLALYTSIRRGATLKIPEVAPLHALWSAYVTDQVQNVDVLAFDQLMKIYGGKIEDIPRFALIGLYSSDIAGHFNGANSRAVENMLIQFDYFLEDFFNLLERQGIRERTYVIVSADHGMHDTADVFHFKEAAKQKGIDVKTKNPKHKDYTLYAADRGVSSTHVYTKRRDGSFAPLENASELHGFPTKEGGTIDLIDFVLSLKPTELMMIRDGESKVVVYDQGQNASSIECLLLNGEHWCSYEVVKGQDPLHLSTPQAKKLMDGKPHSSQAWKQASSDEYYTDAVIQIGTIFQDGRAGDLFIVPKNRWGFRKVKHATHGSLIKDDMHIPMFIRGPTVPKGNFSTLRTVDVFPLLLEWFGFDVPQANHDGVNPFTRYRGENPLWQKLAAIEHAVTFSPQDRSGIRREVAVARNKRTELANLAAMELKHRKALLYKLRSYIDALEEQKRDKHAPKIALDRYVIDHLAIAKRTERLTDRRKRAMERVINILKQKSGVGIQ